MTIADSGALPPAAPSGYDSGSAAFHVFSYANRHGWGPLIGLGVLYLVYYAAVSALAVWSVWPFMTSVMDYSYYDEFGEPDFAGILSGMGRLFTVLPLILILSFVVWSVIEASLLRWMYGRGAKLRFGGVELGLIVLCFLWAFLPIAVFAIPFFLIFVAAAVGEASAGVGALVGLVCALSFIAGIFVWIALAVRFAPAGALTVRDGRIHVFSAWEVSRGRFWPVVGAFVIAIVVYFGVSIVLGIVSQIGGMAVGFNAMSMYMGDFGSGQFGREPDFEALMEIFTSPAFIAFTVVSSLLSAIASFLFQAMLAGVNAYGVKQMGAPV